MMTLSKQRKFTFNSLLEDIKGSKCCVIKVRQYIFCFALNVQPYKFKSNSVTQDQPFAEEAVYIKSTRLALA